MESLAASVAKVATSAPVGSEGASWGASWSEELVLTSSFTTIHPSCWSVVMISRIFLRSSFFMPASHAASIKSSLSISSSWLRSGKWYLKSISPFSSKSFTNCFSPAPWFVVAWSDVGLSLPMGTPEATWFNFSNFSVPAPGGVGFCKRLGSCCDCWVAMVKRGVTKKLSLAPNELQRLEQVNFLAQKTLTNTSLNLLQHALLRVTPHKAQNPFEDFSPCCLIVAHLCDQLTRSSKDKCSNCQRNRAVWTPAALAFWFLWTVVHLPQSKCHLIKETVQTIVGNMASGLRDSRFQMCSKQLSPQATRTKPQARVPSHI